MELLASDWLGDCSPLSIKSVIDLPSYHMEQSWAGRRGWMIHPLQEKYCCYHALNI